MGVKKTRSFFIIKPEAFKDRHAIKEHINSEPGLVIVASKVVKLTKEDIDALYLDDLGSSLLLEIKFYLSGLNVEVGIVEGEEAVAKLKELCGASPDPLKCKIGTIRQAYGSPYSVANQGQSYYLNAIHAATENEVFASLEWFYKKTEEAN